MLGLSVTPTLPVEKNVKQLNFRELFSKKLTKQVKICLLDFSGHFSHRIQ